MIRRLALLPFLGLLGCVGTETGNPPLTSELTVDAHSSNPDFVGIGEDASNLVVEQAWISVGGVTFVGDDDCAAPGNVPAQLAPFGTTDYASAELTTIELDLGLEEVCLVDVPLVVPGAAPAGAPAGVGQYPVFLVGRSSDGTPVEIGVGFETTVPLNAVGGTFALGEGAGLFLGFDVAAWLGGVNLSTATADTDGVIRIDPTQNPSLYSLLEVNLARGLEIYPDDDRDGVPDGPALARGD